LAGHTGCVKAVAITPDGMRVVSASGDTVHVWDLEGDQAPRVLAHAQSTLGVTALAITADSRHMVTGNTSNQPLIWELDGDQLPRILEIQMGVMTLAMTPDGKHGISSGHVGGLAITPDGRIGVSGAEDKTVRVQLRKIVRTIICSLAQMTKLPAYGGCRIDYRLRPLFGVALFLWARTRRAECEESSFACHVDSRSPKWQSPLDRPGCQEGGCPKTFTLWTGVNPSFVALVL